MHRPLHKLIALGGAIVAAAVLAAPAAGSPRPAVSSPRLAASSRPAASSLRLAASSQPVRSARAVPAAVTEPPRAAVTSVCGTGKKPAARKLTVEATMRPVPNTYLMEIKLLLQDRPNAGGAFTTIPLPVATDFGSWLQPDPLTLGRNPNDVWNLGKTETGLVTGYTFRIAVKFRWLNKRSKVLKLTGLATKGCKQPVSSSATTG